MRAAITALPLLVACSSWFGSDSPPATPDAPDGSGADSPPEAAAPELRLREVGPAGAAPRQIVARASAPLFSEADAGRDVTDRVEYRISPDVPGRWTADTRDLLSFTPEAGHFPPGADVTVRVVAIEGVSGAFTPAEGASWERRFQSPPLTFLRVALAERDPSAARLAVDIVFSAPVDPSEAAARLGFTLDGRPVAPASLGRGADASRVRATFLGQRFLGDAALEVAVGAGVPYALDAAIAAPAASGRLALTAGRPMTIEAVTLKEGGDGFFLEVVCKDMAAGGTRWWYDRDTWDGWEVSERCELSEEEAARVVSVDPAVALRVAPGPAGFRLMGAFSQGTYDLAIDAGATTVDGGVLASRYEAEFTVGPRSPSTAFGASGRYLPRSAWGALPVRHRNVERVEVELRHVPPENLVFWLSGSSEQADTRTSTLLARRELPVRGAPDEDVTTWLDLSALAPAPGRGVIEVKVRGRFADDEDGEDDAAHDTGWRRWEPEPVVGTGWTAARLLLSDLSLVAKLSEPGTADGRPARSEVWTWAVDAHTAEPVGGVEISLVRPSGEKLGTCRTDGAGGCAIAFDPSGPDETPPIALIARRGDDLTYLAFDEVRVEPAADVSGRPYRAEQPHVAAVWSDRGAYRPGDVAHVAAIVRDEAHRAPEAGLPVVMSLRDPRGREVRKRAVSSNAAGLVAWDVPFADFARTGTWRVVATVGEAEVGQTSFAVEEFVPERMAVEARAPGDGTLPDEPIDVEIAARWLFGGSAEGSAVEVTCRLEPSPFRPAANADLRYGPADLDEPGRARRAATLGTVRGSLNAEGRATVTCPPPGRSGGFLGHADLVAEVAVFEGDTGRATRSVARAEVHPDRAYVGLSTGTERARGGEPIRVRGAVVDWRGAPMHAVSEAVVEVYAAEEESLWTWDPVENRSRYRRLVRRALVESRPEPVRDGRLDFSVTPASSRSGVIVLARVGDAVTELYVPGSERRWWWDGGATSLDDTPRPAAPTTLALSAPEVARQGDEIVVTARVPYAGQLLWTAETDRVLDHAWQEVQPGEATWRFRVRDFSPNVYVGALLVKDPHLESAEAWMPDRAHGVASVRVEPTAYTLPVSISVPSEVRPRSTLSIELDVGALREPGFATVAVVDQGILSLTDFESPDPAAQLFARRALGVGTYETIGWGITLPPGGPAGAHGGDAAGARGARVQMVKPVALWSGVVEVPASGRATVQVELPGYRGEVRVMAVVATPTRVGHADAAVRVADPLVLQTTLPRFLVAGDEATIPVLVHNRTGRAATVQVSMGAEALTPPGEAVFGPPGPSPLELVGEASASLDLAADASGTARFTVRALRGGAAARLRVDARAGGESSYETLDLPIGHAGVEVRAVERIALADGLTDLAPALAAFEPGSDRSTVWVTTVPYASALAHLRSVVRYPYGCIEQTTSSTRPLLYARGLLQAVDPVLAAEQPVDQMVASGIERILAMQTPGGGFAYWPGGGSPDLWGSIYATHLLIDARQAGYAVPDAPLDEALGWLGREADRRAGTGDGDQTTAYLHYVLARAGQGRAGQAARLLDQLGGAKAGADEARTLLMAALYLSGDRRHADALRAPDLSPVRPVRTWDRSYGSDLRTRGMALATYHDLFGADGAGGQQLAALVGNALSRTEGRWYSTQELGWGMTGLGKWVGANEPVAGVRLRVDGEAREPVSREASSTWAVSGAAGTRSLVVERGGGPEAWAVVATRGVPRSPPPAGGEGLTLSRALLDAQGRPVDSTLGLGQTAYVQLTLRNTSSRGLEELAVVDRVPAGWEIENPRLGGADRPDWATDMAWSVEHMDLRDDRLELFGDLGRGETVRIVYPVRAVTAGTYTRPAATAEAMYAPEVWARTEALPVRVRGPWDGI